MCGLVCVWVCERACVLARVCGCVARVRAYLPALRTLVCRGLIHRMPFCLKMIGFVNEYFFRRGIT